MLGRNVHANNVGRLMATAVLLALSGLLVLGASSAQAAYGLAWNEQANAGGLPGSAQRVTGTGGISAISGHLSSAGDEDMYVICLTGNKTFSATTVNAASADLDTQLFLFNASGLGVYANDDSAGTLQSTLPANHALTPQSQGKYYLAISSYDNDPLSAGGRIFPSNPYFGRVVGPTGPGGSQRITAWTNTGFASGAYTIRLTGARVCAPYSS